MASIRDRLAHAWNAFAGSEQQSYSNMGGSSTFRPDRPRSFVTNERSLITAIINRIAIDAASIPLRHVMTDEEGRFESFRKDSSLDYCLRMRANLDQGGRHFRQDMVQTLLDEGTIAVVATETTLDPSKSTSFEVQSLRVGLIREWSGKKVRVNVYDEGNTDVPYDSPTYRRADRRDIILDKKFTAIVENPLYATMNEPNSTLQRLLRKLSLLDSVDEALGSGKLDLIIQLPYVIKSEARRKQAQQRRDDIELQLKGSKYGIAYTDGTERITQLNRPAENNLLAQIEYLTEMLYGQLGITKEVMNGTADEPTMLNYWNRTIEPILNSIQESLIYAFITKTAQTQGQSIMYFRDPFKLVPVGQIADIADKFSRNRIMSANEMRQVIGIRPSSDPEADKLVNANMPDPNAGPVPAKPTEPKPADDKK